MLTPAEKRKHAEVLLQHDQSKMAHAMAGSLIAQANLGDAITGNEPTTADHCYIDREYPLLGKCRYEGGRLVQIEHPWANGQITVCKQAGIDVAFQWSADPAAGMDQGELLRIWIGTKDAGPRLQWDGRTGKWQRLISNGNYGNNWACGGTWRQDKPLDQREPLYYETLVEADPDIAGSFRYFF